MTQYSPTAHFLKETSRISPHLAMPSPLFNKKKNCSRKRKVMCPLPPKGDSSLVQLRVVSTPFSGTPTWSDTCIMINPSIWRRSTPFWIKKRSVILKSSRKGPAHNHQYPDQSWKNKEDSCYHKVGHCVQLKKVPDSLPSRRAI